MNRRSMQNGAPASTGFRYDMLAEAVLRPTKKTLEKRSQKASEKAARDAVKAAEKAAKDAEKAAKDAAKAAEKAAKDIAKAAKPPRSTSRQTQASIPPTGDLIDLKDDEPMEELEEAIPSAPAKPRLPAVDIKQCQYLVHCSTTFGDKKQLAPDFGNYLLDEFKVHEYNAKSIKAADKAANKAKASFEVVSHIATITGKGVKASQKEIEDPSDWKALEKTLASFMEQRIKMLRVDYIVTYEKTVRPKLPVVAEGEIEALSDVDEPAAKRVFSCHGIMLIAETYYSNGQIGG